MKLNLRTKLIGSFVIMLLLMSIVGFVGVFASREIEIHMENIIEQDVQPASILGVVARRVDFIHSNSLLHLFTSSIDDMTRYESEIADWADKINTNLDSLEIMLKDQTTLDKLSEFRADWNTYLRIWNEQVIPLSRMNRDEEAFALARKGGAAGMVAQEAMYKLDELHNAIIATSDNSLVLAKQHFRKTQIILLAIIIFAIILGLAFGIKQGSHIAGAVNTVSEAAQLVAAGDLDQRVKVKTGDEIESMADSFNTMTGNLKKMVKELHREITERHRAEEALQENEQWLSTTLRSIGDAVIATDSKGFVTFMNSVAVDLTDWDEAEAVGRPLEDVFNIINQQTGQPVENPATRVLREGVIVGLGNHAILIARDGTKRPIADSGAPIRDEEGNIIGIVIVFRDITESRRVEKELEKHHDHLEELVKERTEALQESEERLAGIVTSVTDHMNMIDEHHNIVWVNDAGKQVFGTDLTGKKCYEVYYGRDRICEPCLVAKTFADGKFHEHETEVTGADGKGINFWCTANVSARYEDGRPRLVVEVFRDITERKHLENQLRQVQKMEAIGTLAGGIAHDFNNILSPIMGYTEMALSDLPVESESREDLIQVLNAAERARDLIGHILAFSRQTEGERKPIDLAAIVREALKLLQAALPATIEIKQNIASDKIVVNGDPTQIHQVLMNLCTNAEHAMRKKNGVLEVSLANVDLDEEFCAGLEKLTPGSYVQLSISDTGYGMDKKTLERIFDPFFTTKDPDEGTGMGLSVVHGIVKDHEGHITVHSEPDIGTTFTVYLPAIESIVEALPEKMKPVRGGTESILIVDDETVLVEMTGEILKRLGYRVTTLTSSIEALELFRAEPDEFDLVITDQTMPEMTGDTLAVELLRINPDIPIILCTGFSNIVSPEKARALGICKMMMKPIVGAQLERIVRQVLDAINCKPEN